jgi:hypothetical protein
MACNILLFCVNAHTQVEAFGVLFLSRGGIIFLDATTVLFFKGRILGSRYKSRRQYFYAC